MKKVNFTNVVLAIAVISVLAMAYCMKLLEKEKTAIEWEYEVLAKEWAMLKQDIARNSLKKAHYRILGDGKCEMWIPCDSVKAK